jgi:hypothetical protein
MALEEAGLFKKGKYGGIKGDKSVDRLPQKY